MCIRDRERAEKKAASGAKKTSNKREDSPMIQNQAASTTLEMCIRDSLLIDSG